MSATLSRECHSFLTAAWAFFRSDSEQEGAGKEN